MLIVVQEKFYYDGTRYRVTDMSVESDKDYFDFFRCIVRGASAAQKASIGEGGHLLADHKVVITDRDGSTAFEGFLESVIPAGSDLILEGRDYKVLLLDERVGRDVWINKTGAQIITDLLAYSTKVVAGTITFPETISGTFSFNHDNILRCIASVCAQEGKDFWVINDAGTIKLNIGDRSRGTEVSPQFSFEAGKEIQIAVEGKPTLDTVNRQRVFGAGDGINQIQVCVPWIDIDIPDDERTQGFDGFNANCVHADATTSQGTVGIMEGKPYIDTSLVDVDSAIRSAKAILDASSVGLIDLTVGFLKYIPGVQIGDWVRIIDRKQGVDRTKKVITVKRNFVANRLELEFVNSQATASELLSRAKRDSDFSNIDGLGATNLLELNFPDICDNTHPYEFTFQLPDEVKFINRIKLSYIVSDYRAFTEVTTGGGLHDHDTEMKDYDVDSGSLSGNVYVVGARWEAINSEYRHVTNGAVTRTIRGETSTEIAVHTHPIDYSISEAGAPALTDVEIWTDDGSGYVDRTAAIEAIIGTLSTSEELDILMTNYFTADGGIKKIKIVPASASDGECRITGLLMVMFYMESK